MESTIDDAVKSVERFRILCVGKSGVGKSSLINRVFGLQEASVAHWDVGPANIEKGLTSDENKFLMLHDSKGLESGDANTFDIAHKFITERRDELCPLNEQLHALWLCTETPVAGGRFETGDEKLLQLAQRTDTPVVVVFTKYDQLIRTMWDELRNDKPGLSSDDLDERAKEEAQKVLAISMQALGNAIRKMDPKMTMPTSVQVSTNEGYKTHISSLVETTRDVIQENLRAKGYVDTMFMIAQRVDPKPKIDNSFTTSKSYYKRAPIDRLLLRNGLKGVHQSITNCWNFNDKTGILNDIPFRQLMLYLVQDVQESLNRGGSSYTRSSAIDQISQFLSQATTDSTVLPPKVPDSLEQTLLLNDPLTQALFIAYTVDLTRVLTSLFGIINGRPSEITWSDLQKAFDVFKDDGSLKRIHSRICEIYKGNRHFLDPKDNSLSVFDSLKVLVQAPPKPSPGPQPKTAQVPKTTPTPGSASNSEQVVVSKTVPASGTNPATTPTPGSASNSEQVVVSKTVPASGTNPATAVQPVEKVNAGRRSTWRSRLCPCLAPQRS